TTRAPAPLQGADRLAVLTVSFTDRTRSIVAGIRTERPSLDALVGAQALFVVNLPPKTLREQLSEGMLFDIGFADGLRPAFAQPEWPVPDGGRAGETPPRALRPQPSLRRRSPDHDGVLDLRGTAAGPARRVAGEQHACRRGQRRV